MIFSSPQEIERSTNDERRASVRYPGPLQFRWKGIADKNWQEGQVRDISTLGIGLVLDQRRDMSSFLEVELLDNEGKRVNCLLARVVHLEEEFPGQWLLGCAFVSELPQEDLANFRADAVLPAGPDQRRWTRFPCNVETVCYTCETAPGERRSGRILNVSAGGIGLLLRCSFTQGTLLFFDLPSAPGQPPRQILIRVVRVLEHSKGNWFLGCEFAAQIQDDELRSLLSL
jgi:hypothetical protein